MTFEEKDRIASSKHVLVCFWLSSSSSGRGKSMDDQLLDLALMY